MLLKSWHCISAPGAATMVAVLSTRLYVVRYQLCMPDKSMDGQQHEKWHER